ncbi:MAG: hypothetical protein ACI8TQ_002898 [Planctomycetota bacterium]|jgi:hypothetical protein
MGGLVSDPLESDIGAASECLYSGLRKWDKRSVTTINAASNSSPISTESKAFPEVVLTLAEAAWASGFSRTELQALISRGELNVRRVVRAGRVVAVLAMKDVERVHQSHADAEAVEVKTGQDLRERVARLEGELETSERVERALQRYTDRLEERSQARIAQLEEGLAIARQREMTLARALGRVEGQVARLSEGGDSNSDRLAERRRRGKQSKAR